MKRIVCAVLSVLMLVSVLNFGTITVSAASSLTTSDAAVEILKQFEGFHSKAYADNGQYSIGYGTSCNPADYPDGITEEKAVELLRASLEKCEKTTNSIADKHGLTFTQGQFDALVLFAYNLGYGWYVGQESGTLYQAIINGATGNDLIYAMTLWCKASGSVHTGLVNRRLAEANLYLNGAYSKNPPANYSYVVFNGNGGSASISVQGYDAADPVAVKATATKSGSYFSGWYTQAKGGDLVTKLDTTTKGKTLYAHWQNNAPVATGTVTASALFVRSTASADGTVVSSLAEGTKVELYEITTSGKTQWGRVDGGWICLTYVKLDGAETEPEETKPAETTPSAPDTVIATGTVTAGALVIRKGAGTGYDSAGYYAEGTKIEIFEKQTVGSTVWGRTDKGWVSLKYVKLDETEAEPTKPAETTEPTEATKPAEETKPEETKPEATEPSETTPTVLATGKVTASSLVIRKGAGTNYAQVGSYAKGTRVEILEKKTVGTTVWGRTSKGWISLNYVKLDETETKPTEPAEPDTVIATGTVTASALNIRKGPATTYDSVGSYANGAKVEILEKKTVGSTVWGRTDKGWICLTYVKLDAAETKPEETKPEETKPEETKPEETKPEETKPETTEPSVSETAVAEGTVTGTVYLRKTPGSAGTIIGSIAYGEKISFYSFWVADGIVWGRTAGGWVSMNYLKLTTPITATITSGLNIRSGAGTGYSCVGSYGSGDKVKITETRTVNSSPWGHTDKGWINLKYAKLDHLNNDSSAGSTETPGTTEKPDTVLYTGTVTADGALSIRRGPSVGYGVVGYYAKGTKVEILEMEISGSTTWGRTDKGWISLTFVKLDETTVTPPATEPSDSTKPTTPGATEEPTTPTTPSTPTTPTALGSGKITASSLSVRKGASAKAAVKGTVSYGTAVTIYDLSVADGVLWAQTENGWLSTNYVSLDAPLNAEVTASGLYIRSKAGTSGSNVGMYLSGEKVSIYETKTVNSSPWGRTDKGWINLKYVKFGTKTASSGTTETTPTTPSTETTEPSSKKVIATGTVDANSLSVRNGGSASSAIIGSVSGDAVVSIYELKLSDGILWGHIEQGWISMNYVKLNAPLNGKITASALYIRTKASLSSTTVDCYYSGDSVKIQKTATADGMAWALTEKGWISLKYVELT